MATAKYKKNSRGQYEAKIWDGTYNANGTKHRKTLYSRKSSADLERLVAEFKAKRDNQTATVFTDLSFYGYALNWLNESKAVSEVKTREMYETVINSYLVVLDDIPVNQITRSHFQKVINLNVEHPRTCQQIDLTFKQIIKDAVRRRILPKSALDDVLADISLPKYIPTEKRPLTALEKQAIKNVDMSEMKTAFVHVLLYLGVRRGEALALTPNSFNWDDNTVSIREVVIFTKSGSEIKPYPKSDNGIRSIPLSKSAIETLKPFVLNCTTPYLFHGRNGALMTKSAYDRMWQSIVTNLNKAVGYNPYKRDRGEPPIQGLTAHIFRHNFCTELCYRVPEISTKMIARLMGDTEKMVLDVYNHIVAEKENVSDVLETIKL